MTAIKGILGSIFDDFPNIFSLFSGISFIDVFLFDQSF